MNYTIIKPIKIISFITAIFLIFVIEPILNSRKASNVQELHCHTLIAQADSLYEVGKINDALTTYQFVYDLIENSKESSRMLYKISTCYKKLGIYHLAIASLDSILQKYSESVDEKQVVYQLGNLNFIIKNYEEAYEYFTKYLEEYDDSELRGRIQFQLAYTNQKQENYATAIHYYRESMDELPLLSDYAMYYIAECYHNLGVCDSSSHIYANIQKFYDNSALSVNIEREIADCFYDNDHYEKAAESYQSLLHNNSSRLSAFHKSKILYRIGFCFEELDQPQTASDYYFTITNAYPKKSYAYKSIKALERIGYTKNPKIVYEFGRISYYNGYYYDAIDYFRKFIALFPDHKDADSAHYLIGRSYDRARRRRNAIEEYKSLLLKYPNSNLRVHATKQIAECYRKLGDDKNALEQYNHFKKTYPNETRLVDDSYYEIGRIYERSGRFEKAIQTYNYLINNRKPKKRYIKLALWRVVQTNYKLKKYDESIHSAKQFLGYFDNGSDRSKISYWIGKNYYTKGQTSRAYSYFTETYNNYPDYYYGRRAKNQLTKHKWKNLVKTTIPAISKQTLTKEKNQIIDTIRKDKSRQYKSITDTIHWKKGKLLIELGFFEDGYNELMEIQSNNSKDLLTLLELSYLYSAARRYDNAAICAREISHHVNADSLPGLNRLLFPICYPEYISVASQTYNLDPLFICALIKQESWFNPNATSWANARGLMQVIPSTARQIASELNIENFAIEQLYNPKLSIKFGTYYINKQIDAFDGVLEHALAAYNGGPGNSKRWKKGTNDIDEFVEDIEFSETKKYVKIVMNNYWKYLELWRNHD